MVDGVEGHLLGPHEASDALQLARAHIVLEDDVIGEVDAAVWFE